MMERAEEETRPRSAIRRWLLWLLIVAGVWIVVSRMAEVRKLAEILAQGQWEWVLLAAALQLLFYWTFAAIHHAAFETVGVKSRIIDLLPVWFASIFVNVVAPTAGPALFVDDAAQRGESPAKTAAGTVLVRIADFGTFALILAVGLAYLFRYHALHVYELVGTAILLLIVYGWIGVLLLGLWRPEKLHRFLLWVQQGINRLAWRFSKTHPLAEGWAEKNAGEFSEAARSAAERPRGLACTLLLALFAHLVDLASLYVLFLAFHQPVRFGTLVAGFGVGVLFWIVSITPEGIGVVEGVMTLVYSSLGVPLEGAMVVVLAFRGLTFWLPLFLGFLVARRVSSFRK